MRVNVSKFKKHVMNRADILYKKIDKKDSRNNCKDRIAVEEFGAQSFDHLINIALLIGKNRTAEEIGIDQSVYDVIEDFK